MVPRPMKKMVFIIPLLLFFSCNLDKDTLVDRKKFSFKTGDDTELFFKNVRQSYYDLEENKAAKFNVFRHENRVKEADHPLLNAAIVVNFMNDEAYILLEPNEQLVDLDKLHLFWSADMDQGGEIVLNNYNREEMLEFASQVYEAIRMHAKFNIEMDGERVPVLTNEAERKAFRVTLSDYYRLTRVY